MPKLRVLEEGGSGILFTPSMRPLHARGIDRLFATVFYCVDAKGAVYGVRMLRSTGVDVYDQDLAQRYEGMRFEPYRDGDHAVAFCTLDGHVIDLR
ncbi:MAG: hypothetical protein JO257_30450 [Deltaproteobacteria bacterium]|nr:hypothetical protein [Deltaproteobacteria bacterium]